MEPSAPDRRARNLAGGRSRFVDDAIPGRGMLEVALVAAPYARAALVSIDAEAARAHPGVRAVLTSVDIGGVNNLSPEAGTMPLLASDAVEFHGQPVAVVVADDLEAARLAATLVKVEYQPRPPVLGIEEAIALQSFHGDEQVLERGEPEGDPMAYGGYFGKGLVVAGQEHFALETGVAWAEPGDDGDVIVSAAAEDLGFVRRGVAGLLGVPMSRVKVTCPRVGGSFGGKITGALIPAGVAALAAHVTGRPVRVRFDREEEFRLTGKQNPAYVELKGGYDSTGRLGLIDCLVYLDGGWAVDRAQSVLRNILHHLDSAYYIPNVRLIGRVCKTNLPPTTSTISGGAAMAALVVEEIIAEVATRLEVVPEAIRQRNFYGSEEGRDVTHYGQDIEDLRLGEAWSRLLDVSSYSRRRTEIDAWNEKTTGAKRGLAVVPVKVGSGAPEAEARQASSTVSLLPDGSAQVMCGEVEIGGGMRRTIAAFVGDQLGIGDRELKITAGETDQVAAAHHGELHAEAVLDACRQLRERLRMVAFRLLQAKGVEVTDLMELRFANGGVADIESPGEVVPMVDLVRAASADDINVSATGYSNAAEILGGRTFRDFACGAAAAEVLVDGFTGEVKVIRVDVVQDVGRQLDPEAELGLVRGAFVQGLGWLSCEDLVWSAEGEMLTANADSYLIPTAAEAPMQFKVELMPSYGGYPKEPGAAAFCLALSAREAIRDAIGAFGNVGPGFVLPSPATPEAVYFALRGEGQRFD